MPRGTKYPSPEKKYQKIREKNGKKGLFIAIEGVDGVGKTTLARNLAKLFEEAHYRVFRTAEPYRQGSPAILEAIKTCKDHASVLALLYAANRSEHLVQAVIPALLKGGVVICDRYIWSTMAYQHLADYGRQAIEYAAAMTAMMADLVGDEIVLSDGSSGDSVYAVPDATILLEPTANDSVRLQTVQSVFNSLARANPGKTADGKERSDVLRLQTAAQIDAWGKPVKLSGRGNAAGIDAEYIAEQAFKWLQNFIADKNFENY